MKYGSLFTGIGGFDLGFDQAGMECAWQVEIDPKCQEVLGKHWPGVERYTDVSTAGSHNLEPVDLICGGFPCQDLSVAGRRAGLAGSRSGLWFDFERIIGELAPRWVVVENVPGLLSSNGGEDFAVILRGLVERGYGVAWRILDSQYFGVAQRRRRVFVVASLGSGRAAEVLFEREGGAWDTAPSRETGEGIARPVKTFSGGIDREDMHTLISIPDPAYAVTGEGHRFGSVRDGQDTFVTATLRGFGHGWQGQHNDTNAVMVWQNKQQSGEIRYQEDNLPTMSRYWGTGGNNVPFVGVRRLTPVECARLQGFPDDWCGWLSDSTQYRMYGNAVTVSVTEWTGRRILEAERG